MSDVSAWHFAEQTNAPYITGWNCETGAFLTSHEARMKMVEVGGVAVSEMDADRRRWWATANPELAKGNRWWGLPTPADAPMAGEVGLFRGGWKDYGTRMGFSPSGASPLSEKGYDIDSIRGVNEPQEKPNNEQSAA